MRAHYILNTMEQKKRLSEFSELPGDLPNIPARTSKEWAPAELSASPQRPSSVATTDEFGRGSPKLGGTAYILVSPINMSS